MIRKRPGLPLRLFIAVELAEEARQGLLAVIASLHRPLLGMKWTRPEQLHLTIKFLGQVDEGAVPEIAAALDQAVAGFAPFSLSLHGLGAFPDTSRPSIIWAGCDAGAEPIVPLARAVEQAMTELDFEPEAKRYTPHITLGRIKQAIHVDLARLLASCVQPQGATRITQLTLFSSELGRTGSIYVPLHQSPLRP